MKEYFSHDYNARHDKKIAALVGKYKGAGYGIFWATCEMMHEEGGELELDDLTYSAISKNINEDEILLENVIKDCIEKFKLFLFLDGKITSNRVKKNLHKRLNISKIRSKAGKEGAKAKQTKAIAKQKQAKEIKGKEIKESKLNGASDFVCYDAEEYILKNQQLFEKICIATAKGSDIVKKELHAFHLWLEKNNKYPSNNKSVAAGLESWLLNDYKKSYNSSVDVKNKNSFI